MGSYTGNVNVDMEYPFAFQVAFASLLEKQPSRPRFRFIHLSGLFVIQDQKAKLWVNDFPRKLKAQPPNPSPTHIANQQQGLYEVRSQKLAEEHASIWRTFMLRPGGVITRRLRVPGKLLQILLGDEWVISNEELGAFFTYLAVEGEREPEDTFLIQNPVIAQRGRKILREKQ
jgi:hypothetical protein